MYQTRSSRKLSLLKDKVNIVPSISNSNFSQNDQTIPKKLVNSCKINLRKRNCKNPREAVLSTSGTTNVQNNDKENLTADDSLKCVQKGDLKKVTKNSRKALLNAVKTETVCSPSIDKENLRAIDNAKENIKKEKKVGCKEFHLCKKKAVCKKVENCNKSNQKKGNKTETNQVLVSIENNTDIFKSLNKRKIAVPMSSLIYNECPADASNRLAKKHKKTIVDVYDINADDDFKKEELDLKKCKKLKLLNKKEIKKCSSKQRRKKNEKLLKKCAEKQVQGDFIKSKTGIQNQSTGASNFKTPNDLNTDIQDNHLRDISTTEINTLHRASLNTISSEKIEPAESSKGTTNNNFKAPNDLNINIQDNHLRDISTTEINTLHRTSLNTISSEKIEPAELFKCTTNKENMKNNKPPPQDLPMASITNNDANKNNNPGFMALCENIPVQELNPRDNFNKNGDLGKIFLREATPVREINPCVPDLTGANEDSVNFDECSTDLMPQTSTPQNGDKACLTLGVLPAFSFATRLSEIPAISISPLKNIQKSKCSDKLHKPNLNNESQLNVLMSEIPISPIKLAPKNKSCPEQDKLNSSIQSLLNHSEVNVLSDEENELEYVTALNSYSLVLFGSPEKAEEVKAKYKKPERVLQFDVADKAVKKLNKNKQVGETASNFKKPDFITKKSANEKKQEDDVEAFYKSFNDQLSEFDNYELCIE